MEVVESGLPHRDDVRVADELVELVDPRRFAASRVMGIDADGREDALLPLGDRERRTTRLDARADRDHAGDAGRARALNEHRGRLVASVEVRVGVDHAAVRPPSRRGELEAGEQRRGCLDPLGLTGDAVDRP